MHERMFILEAFEYHPEYKRWSRICMTCIPEDQVAYNVQRMIADGYRMTVKPKWPDEFWSKDEE